MHGFRAIAERSVLADVVKDSGAVSLFPGLAEEWRAETQAESGWRGFTAPDFQRVMNTYRVSWGVVESPGPTGMPCPYESREIAECRIEGSTGLRTLSIGGQLSGTRDKAGRRWRWISGSLCRSGCPLFEAI
jgi:hypothetical protein